MSGEMSSKTKTFNTSKIGRKPIAIPSGVEIEMRYSELVIKGPKGTLVQPLHPEAKVKLSDGSVIVEQTSSRKFHKALHGLTRSIISNGITGVTDGYQKTLELMGLGYRVQQSGDGIVLNVGHSHPVDIKAVEGVTITVEGNNRIHVQGIDKQKVGQLASVIRKVRPCSPYKEKGIKYSDEILRLKPGKSATRKA